MSSLSHAVAGASAGYIFGQPALGALCGVLPDLVLNIRRLLLPSELYNFTHSLAFAGLVGLAGVQFGTAVPSLAILTHLALDVPTHGSTWAPPLLYPLRRRYSLGAEWEWFTRSWWTGLGLTFNWSLLCYFAHQYLTGGR